MGFPITNSWPSSTFCVRKTPEIPSDSSPSLLSPRQSEVLPLRPSGGGARQQEDPQHGQEVSCSIDTHTHTRMLLLCQPNYRKSHFSLQYLICDFLGYDVIPHIVNATWRFFIVFIEYFTSTLCWEFRANSFLNWITITYCYLLCFGCNPFNAEWFLSVPERFSHTSSHFVIPTGFKSTLSVI